MTDSLEEKWNSAIESVKKEEITIFHTRKLDDEFLEKYLAELPNMRCSTFRITPPTPYDNSIKKESTMKERTCPICETHLIYGEYLLSNTTEDDILKEYWENLEIEIPCCKCYRLLYMIQDKIVEVKGWYIIFKKRYGDKKIGDQQLLREDQLEGLKRFGVIE